MTRNGLLQLRRFIMYKNKSMSFILGTKLGSEVKKQSSEWGTPNYDTLLTTPNHVSLNKRDVPIIKLIDDST